MIRVFLKCKHTWALITPRNIPGDFTTALHLVLVTPPFKLTTLLPKKPNLFSHLKLLIKEKKCLRTCWGRCQWIAAGQSSKRTSWLETQPNSQLLVGRPRDHSSTWAETLHPPRRRGRHPDRSGPNLEMGGACKTLGPAVGRARGEPTMNLPLREEGDWQTHSSLWWALTKPQGGRNCRHAVIHHHHTH